MGDFDFASTDDYLIYADWLEDEGGIAAAEAIRYKCSRQQWSRWSRARSVSRSGSWSWSG